MNNSTTPPVFPIKMSLSVLLLVLLTTTTPSPVAAEKPDQQYSSVEERRLVNTIQMERENIREEKKELEQKKKELKTIEEGVDKKLAEIDGKLEEMRKLRKKIESLLADKSEEEKKRTQDLANIYAKMVPAKAALAISGLDRKLAADLIANMKVKAAAKILDQIPKKKATELSTTFSTIPIE